MAEFGPTYKQEDEIEVYGRKFPSFSRREIHPAISRVMANLPKGTVLDMPTGAGALAWRLHNEGFDVTGADLFPQYSRNPEISVTKADLNATFPFDDDQFDYVCFVEGPEHVENVFFCLREFARVLKPDGTIILSIPNYSNLQNRLKELLYGTPESVVTKEKLVVEYDNDPHMIHINRVRFPELKMALEFAGFRITSVNIDKVKSGQRLLWPLAALIKLVTFFRGDGGEEKYGMRENNSDPVLMGGNTLIITARLAA